MSSALMTDLTDHESLITSLKTRSTAGLSPPRRPLLLTAVLLTAVLSLAVAIRWRSRSHISNRGLFNACGSDDIVVRRGRKQPAPIRRSPTGNNALLLTSNLTGSERNGNFMLDEELLLILNQPDVPHNALGLLRLQKSILDASCVVAAT